MQDGEPNLAGTARAAGRADVRGDRGRGGRGRGGKVTVATERGAVTVPVEIRRHARPGRVAAGVTPRAGGVRRELRAGHGTLVTLRSAE